MRLRVGQIGTRHGHAVGKWQALCANPDVEPVGIWEPDRGHRRHAEFGDAVWFDAEEQLLDDPEVVIIAIEGRNHQSLAMAAAAIQAGKHIWFDKPAGDDWPTFQQLMHTASARQLHVQLGYMFRYSPGFVQVTEWARSGLLGHVYAVRAHMSTWVDLGERTEQSRHRGGILYDLGGHMLDQIVWLLGRPTRVATTLRNDATPELPGYADNTLSMLEFDSGLASLDIAAIEAPPPARRLEVFGTRGSAILEPFDPARTVRLCLQAPSGDYAAGEQLFELPDLPRQALYARELAAFVGVVRGERPPDRPPAHELLVQETLLRVTGGLA